MTGEVIGIGKTIGTGKVGSGQFWRLIEAVLTPGRMMMAFLLVYYALAIYFQAIGKVPASRDGSPIEMFTGGLLWMLSATCLIGACVNARETGRSLIWLLACAALGAVAIDELFAYHEKTRFVIEDDDYAKIGMFLGSALIVAAIIARRSANRPAAGLLYAGLAWHFIYLLVDMGDGDYFSVPFVAIEVLQYVEEICELTSLAFYFSAFIHLLLEDVQRLERRHVAPAPEPGA